MFEKESEDYVLKTHCASCWQKDADGEYACTGLEYCNRHKDWQKGAEFGYKKANEWHHVKEGELPKENMIDVLALVKSSNGDLIPYIANYSHYSKEWHPDFDDEEVIKVIYWKEIILPKE